MVSARVFERDKGKEKYDRYRMDAFILFKNEIIYVENCFLRVEKSLFPCVVLFLRKIMIGQ